MLWDLRRGEEIARMMLDATVRRVEFDATHRRVVAGDATGAAHIRELADGPGDG